MGVRLLLTGDPGCGKTTVIRRVIARWGGAAGGFYTRELRVEGDRRGFEMVALDGPAGVLAHVEIAGPPRVGRYGVDLAALEAVGVAALRRALDGAGLIVIDELGPMEFFSAAFRRVVWEALDGGRPVLGTVVKRSTPFGDQIKARPDVALIHVHAGNRDALVGDLLARLNAG